MSFWNYLLVYHNHYYFHRNDFKAFLVTFLPSGNLWRCSRQSEKYGIFYFFFFSSANVENIYYMLARRYRWQRRYFPFLANIKFVFSNLCVMKTSLKMRWSIQKYNRCNLTSEPLGNVFLAYFEPYYIIK